MNALEPLVDEAREHLLARAKREGLVRVGYDIMDSPLGPLWIAVGPRGVENIHYGATPDPRELARITHTYGPSVLPDRRAAHPLLPGPHPSSRGRRRSVQVQSALGSLTPVQQRKRATTHPSPHVG